MGKYKIGNGKDGWNFSDAYEQMSDGDIMILENNLNFNFNSVFVLKKNITIQGNISIKENGGRVYQNTFHGGVVVDGAEVHLKDIWIEPVDENCGLVVKNKGNAIVDNCYFNFKQKSTKYSIFVSSESHLTLKNTSGATTEGSASGIKGVEKSQLTLENSNVIFLELNDSTGNVIQTNLKGEVNSNTITLRASSLTLKNSTVVGLGAKDNCPVINCDHSEISSENTTITQPQYDSALWLYNNSCLKSKEDTISSIDSHNSRVFIENSTLKEVLGLQEGSYGKVTGKIEFLGNNSDKIDFYCTDKSSFIIEQGIFHRILSPNARLKEESFLNIENLEFPEGDISKLSFEADETSASYIRQNETEQANNTSEGIQEEKVNALEELNSLTGLTRVKTEIDKMIKMVQFNKQLVAQGRPPMSQSLHAVFMGNPGTGKTTVARLMGQVLFENGALSGDKFVFVEATESDLVSNHVGETALNTMAKLEEAKGGILFIDEAYTLNKKGASVNFGQEAIDTILKYMEDHRDEIMIVFAGYTKEMEEFLRTNPGLQSRVPNKFIFDDYTSTEIIQMGKQILDEAGYVLENPEYYEKNVARSYNGSMDKSNGRWIRNFNEQLIKSFAYRVIEEGSEDVSTIKDTDIDALLNKDKFISNEQEDAFSELMNLIGIPKVKAQVKQFIDLAAVNKRREELSDFRSNFTLHSLFLGNPGTGKTTVARLLGKILYEKDIIPSNKFIEASRSDLVAGYVGQTAMKTREVLQSALGGVLFIDEAYSLYKKGTGNDFGLEAIEEILKFMEDHRGDIVIILAGYTKEMADFMAANSGLTSRIPTTFDFEDYTPEEIYAIGELGLKKQGYHYNQEYYHAIVVKNYLATNDKSNGRWVRNFNERLVSIASSRIARENSADLFEITVEDLDKVSEVL